MPFSPRRALRVTLRPSPAAGLVLLVAHVGAALGALALPFAPWSVWVAAGVLIPSAWCSLRRHAFRRGPRAIVGIAHSDSGGWRLSTARGERIEGCTPSSALVHPRLIVASFSTPRGRFGVLLPEGATDADEARRLRIALRRLSAGAGEAGDGATRRGPGASRGRTRLTSLRDAILRIGPRSRTGDAG